MILKNQDKFMYYDNNYISCNPFNQLYDHNQIKKEIKNADAVLCKIRPALIRAVNHKLKVDKEEKPKKKKW